MSKIIPALRRFLRRAWFEFRHDQPGWTIR